MSANLRAVQPDHGKGVLPPSEHGHRQGETFMGPFPLRPSPGRRHGATWATSLAQGAINQPVLHLGIPWQEK